MKKWDRTSLVNQPVFSIRGIEFLAVTFLGSQPVDQRERVLRIQRAAKEFVNRRRVCGPADGGPVASHCATARFQLPIQ